MTHLNLAEYKTLNSKEKCDFCLANITDISKIDKDNRSNSDKIDIDFKKLQREMGYVTSLNDLGEKFSFFSRAHVILQNIKKRYQNKLSDYFLFDLYLSEESISLNRLVYFGTVNEKKKNRYKGFLKAGLNENLAQKIYDSKQVIKDFESVTPLIICNLDINLPITLYRKEELWVNIRVLDVFSGITYKKRKYYLKARNDILDELKKLEKKDSGRANKDESLSDDVYRKLALDRVPKIYESIKDSLIDLPDVKNYFSEELFSFLERRPENLPGFYTYLFWLKYIAPFDWREYIYFSGKAYLLEKGPTHERSIVRDSWIGGFAFAFKELTSPEDRISFRYFPRAILADLYSQYELLKVSNSEKKLREEAIKNAISRIISRSDAHNIGSNIISSTIDNRVDLPDIKLLLKYIQQRMDFVALVTTKFPRWSYPVKFVDDLMNRFFLQRLVLNYIASSEKLGAWEYRGTRKNTPEDIGKLVVIVKQSGSEDYIINPYQKEKDLVKKDVTVAIPGGIVGQHAFFMILENIIRNSAKHDFSKRDDKCDNLEITIEFEDDIAKDKIGFLIWSNASKIEEGDKGNPLHKKVNTKLSAGFLKVGAPEEMVEGNWGLSEMKIAAGFLGKMDRVTIGSPNEIEEKNVKNKKIIYAIKHKNNYNPKKKEDEEFNRSNISDDRETIESNDSEVCYLGYRFSIPRPKHIFVNQLIPEEGLPRKTFVKRLNRIFRKHCFFKEESKQSRKVRKAIDGQFDRLIKLGIETKDDILLGGEIVVADYKRSGIYFNEGNHFSYDYEFVILFDDGTDTFICQLREEVEREGSVVMDQQMEGFPFRLFVVTEKGNEEVLQKKIRRFQRRIVVLDNEMFWEKLKKKESFNEWLYETWIRHLLFLRNIRYGKRIDLLVQFAGKDTKHLTEGELNKTAFEKYRDKIVRKIKSDDSEFDKKMVKELKLVTLNDILKVNRSRLANGKKDIINRKSLFVKYWYLLAINKRKYKVVNKKIVFENKKIQDPLRNDLFGVFTDFIEKEEMILKSRKTYEEIETLPKVFTSDVPTFSNEHSTKKMDTDLVNIWYYNNFEKLTDQTAGIDRILISYNRHGIIEKFNESVIYNDVLSGGQVYYSQLLHTIHEAKTKYQLIENALMRILIIDERVNNYVANNPEMVGVYRRLGISISCEVASWSTEKDEKSRTVVMSKECTGMEKITFSNPFQLRHFQIIVIHQGIVDKLYPNDTKVDISKKYTALKRLIPFVVVTSGRGRPQNIPDNVKYISYPNISDTILKPHPEKMQLTQLIMGLVNQ